MSYGITICGGNAINSLTTLLNSVKNINGDVVEIGVYKGGSALLISNILDNDNIFLFDTFEGMPETDDFDNVHKKGDFNDTNFEDVSKLFSDKKNVQIFKGIFPKENYEILLDKKFKFVHIDVDIYDSYKNCLDFFHDKMVNGGLMVFDDYNAPTCLGAKKAVDEYIEKYNLTLNIGGDGQTFINF